MKAIIIGGGVGGLGTAALLAKQGYQVQLFEKNEQLGGRATLKKHKGFAFDLGPSWYLMPDVFERFFESMGADIKDYLKLKKLSPSYRVFFKDKNIQTDIFADLAKDKKIFEALEPGAGKKLEEFIKLSKKHYQAAMQKFVYKNYDSIFDFFSYDLIKEGLQLGILNKMQKYVEKYFKSPELQKLVQYQLVFLGNSPYNAPAIYNIMSYVDFELGVFYPQGGIYEISKALTKLGQKHGVKFQVNSPVKKIIVENGQAKGVVVKGKKYFADLVISNADLEHTENKLLEKKYRSFSDKYWNKTVLAPSGFILYLGVKGKVKNALHHNLIFSADWRKNFGQIFDRKVMPDDPSMYICVPSKTDSSVAPAGHENLFVFVPIPAGLKLSKKQLNAFYKQTMQTIAAEFDEPDLEKRLVYKEIFCIDEFKKRYNSFQGSALGLAHTFGQTAIFRPDNCSKKVKNLFYVGADTNPGIGVPMCLISAELVVERVKSLR